MELFSLMLGALVVAQGGAAGRASVADISRAGETVKAAPRRATAPELVATWFAVPVGGTIAGRPLTLLESLSATADRPQQLAITHAYWRLAALLGEYHVRFDAAERLRRITPRFDDADADALRARRLEAIEALQRVERETARAQQELTQAARLNAGSPLPLPADLPLAGPYRTNFSELYAVEKTPVRARLIDRTLPLRRQGIKARAAAVRAAEDALEGSLDAYRDRTGDLAAILSCLVQATERRAALVAEVRRYNDAIADYALSVAGAQASPRELVTMLIFPSSAAGGAARGVENLASPQILPTKRAATAPRSGVEPATWLSSEPEGRMGRAIGSRATGEPTPAPPEPTSARGIPPVLPAGPAAAPPKPLAEPERAAKTGGPSPRVAQRPTDDRQSVVAGSSSASYPGLVSASASSRVKYLSMALYAPDSRAGAGRPVELEACLRGLPPGDRRGTIDAYWIASERAAEYRVWAEERQLLARLVPLALARREQSSGALDMLRLRAACLASDADAAAAHVELLEAQFELTRRAGKALDGPWLIPSTAPYSGAYLLRLEAQRPELVKQPAIRRLAASIPALAGGLREQAAAVVEADRARAAAATAYPAGGRGIGLLLNSVHCQTVETLAFLQMLTGYNRAIAEYALAVLPPSIPGEQLVQTLVILR